jgi:hypothetical protein
MMTETKELTNYCFTCSIDEDDFVCSFSNQLNQHDEDKTNFDALYTQTLQHLEGSLIDFTMRVLGGLHGIKRYKGTDVFVSE